MTTPTLINEAGKTYIAAVPQLAWGHGRECAFIGALEAALSVTETPYCYEDLMGWSGLAFRMRWYLGEGGEECQHWSDSSPMGELTDEFAALRRATGRRLETVVRSGLAEPHMENLGPRIAAEIRTGRPVLAHDPEESMGVIYGFEQEGQIVLMHDYMSDDPVVRIPASELGTFVCFLGEQGPSLSEHDALLAGLQRGVDSWHSGFTPAAEGRFWLGHAALLKWREDLERAGGLCFDDKSQLFDVNWWVFDCLVDARANAERFLRRHTGRLTGSPHRHLCAAVEAYAEESRLLAGAKAARHVFLGPWTGAEFQHWTDPVREREIAFLGQLITAESAAIGELENILDAAEAPLPEPGAISPV